MDFEWDKNKNRSNFKKHGIWFEEAQTIFFDPLTKVAADPDHSDNEERFLAIGFSSKSRILLVAHCFRENDSVIRIISARRLTSSERKDFEGGI